MQGTMADDQQTVDAGETFSKEYVEKLKADLAAKAEETAKLRAFKSTHDAKQRDVISKLQPEITSYIEGLVKENADHAPEMQAIVEWGKSCHESNSLETAMPLARVLSCASAQFKRTREEASVLSERAGTLGSTMKELEEVKADNSAKAQRIAELETLCNDRQLAAEKLQDELARAGILKDKFDFSKLSSREAKPEGEAKANADAPAAESSTLTTTTSNASRGVQDELMSFVSNMSRTGGSHRINQSGTGHAHLGATAGSVDGEIASAIRGF